MILCQFLRIFENYFLQYFFFIKRKQNNKPKQNKTKTLGMSWRDFSQHCEKLLNTDKNFFGPSGGVFAHIFNTSDGYKAYVDKPRVAKAVSFYFIVFYYRVEFIFMILFYFIIYYFILFFIV